MKMKYIYDLINMTFSALTAVWTMEFQFGPWAKFVSVHVNCFYLKWANNRSHPLWPERPCDCADFLQNWSCPSAWEFWVLSLGDCDGFDWQCGRSSVILIRILNLHFCSSHQLWIGSHYQRFRLPPRSRHTTLGRGRFCYIASIAESVASGNFKSE